jgi:hypothetical protein
MSTTSLIYQSFLETILIAEISIQRELILPALILIYSGIDSASFLATKDIDAQVNDRFIAWVNRWMYSTKILPCSAEELYSARCGVVHTFTSDSNLTRNKNVRRVAYSWGSSDIIKLQKTMDIGHHGEMVALSVNDLYESYKLGLADFFEFAMKDNSLANQLEARSIKYFSSISGDDAELYLKSNKC